MITQTIAAARVHQGENQVRHSIASGTDAAPLPQNRSTLGNKSRVMPWWQCCFTVAGLALAAAATPPVAAAEPLALRVLRDEYPRAYFFRFSESFAANPHTSYEAWEACFERLMGIEGKALDEELPGRSRRNIEFFTRFKQRHPDQLVMLHYNGDSRDPRDHTGPFFAGHWLYGAGAHVTADVPAQDWRDRDPRRPARVVPRRHRPLQNVE